MMIILLVSQDPVIRQLAKVSMIIPIFNSWGNGNPNIRNDTGFSLLIKLF